MPTELRQTLFAPLMWIEALLLLLLQRSRMDKFTPNALMLGVKAGADIHLHVNRLQRSRAAVARGSINGAAK